MTKRGIYTAPGLETIVCDLHELAQVAREAGIGITWYEPGELLGLDPRRIEEVMDLAANEFIDFNGDPPIQRQLTLDIDPEPRF